MLSDLSPKQFAFLQLTTESGSPYHPFVPALRRMLELPEIVGPDAGKTLPATAKDVEIVVKHHSDPREKGPIYAQREEAIDVLLDGYTWPGDEPAPPAKETPKADPAKDDKPKK